jgi:hypothetical protein
VPKDSVGVKEAGTASTAGKHTSAWRSAGTRASDGSETTQLLYWKR